MYKESLNPLSVETIFPMLMKLCITLSCHASKHSFLTVWTIHDHYQIDTWHSYCQCKCFKVWNERNCIEKIVPTACYPLVVSVFISHAVCTSRMSVHKSIQISGVVQYHCTVDISTILYSDYAISIYIYIYMQHINSIYGDKKMYLYVWYIKYTIKCKYSSISPILSSIYVLDICEIDVVSNMYPLKCYKSYGRGEGEGGVYITIPY